jgi:hypothetical protein
LNWQQFALDRIRRLPYYAGALVGVVSGLNGCGGIGRLAPADLPSATPAQIDSWIAPFRPTQAKRFDVRWMYQTQQGTTRGRAALLFVPPDSVRFDYRAPFGRSGSAVVVGDEIVWSKPEEEVGRMIQVAPLLWAAMGIALPPSPEATLTGVESGESITWRYALPYDTLTYRASRSLPGGRLLAEMRGVDGLVGRVELDFADTVPAPREAMMRFPASASLVQFTVVGIEAVDAVDPSLWIEP